VMRPNTATARGGGGRDVIRADATHPSPTPEKSRTSLGVAHGPQTSHAGGVIGAGHSREAQP
jgi:hypothetical protein